jgi:hypothetical protein
MPQRRIRHFTSEKWVIKEIISSEKRLTEETISPALVQMKYAVRGELVKKAEDIQHVLEEHPEKLIKFDHVLY